MSYKSSLFYGGIWHEMWSSVLQLDVMYFIWNYLNIFGQASCERLSWAGLSETPSSRLLSSSLPVCVCVRMSSRLMVSLL